MKIDTDTAWKNVQPVFWYGLFLFIAWQLNLFTIALIGSVSLFSLWVILGGTVHVLERTGVIKMSYPKGESMDYFTVDESLNFPGQWRPLEKELIGLFQTDPKDTLGAIACRFSEQINVYTLGDEQVSARVIALKMMYEYQRKNGSLLFKKDWKNPSLNAVEVSRRLSDEEQPKFAAFCREQNRTVNGLGTEDSSG